MAADDTGNRATVALVDAKVATVDAKVTGLASLIVSENAATREAIADLKPLPVAVATLQADHDALVQRVTDIEAAQERGFSWRVMAAVSLVAALVGGLIGHVHIPPVL